MAPSRCCGPRLSFSKKLADANAIGSSCAQSFHSLAQVVGRVEPPHGNVTHQGGNLGSSVSWGVCKLAVLLGPLHSRKKLSIYREKVSNIPIIA